MALPTKLRAAVTGAGAVHGTPGAGARQCLPFFPAAVSTPWLSVADDKPVPHCTSAMDCDPSKRDVRFGRQAFLRVPQSTPMAPPRRNPP